MRGKLSIQQTLLRVYNVTGLFSMSQIGDHHGAYVLVQGRQQ
jgi:hypothetical protein